MTEYNDGAPVKVYDNVGKFVRTIPHNARSGQKIARVTEQDLDQIINAKSIGREFTRLKPVHEFMMKLRKAMGLK